MIRYFAFAICLAFAPFCSSAPVLHQNGTVDFTEIVALLEQQPLLKQFIQEHLQTASVGIAPRIGPYDNEKLQGERVAPYEFACKPAGAAGDYTLMLVIDAEITYLDKGGKKARFNRASSFRARLIGISLREFRPGDREYSKGP